MQERTVLINEDGKYDCTPTYLFDHAELYKTNPLEAGLTWFSEAHYGLGVNLGLHSMLGHGQDAMVKDNIALDTYHKLIDAFKVEHFDAVDLVEFAIANGMRYIEFTVCGPDGFCLWNSHTSDFNSAKSPAKRDLLGELASVCEYHGIGLCLNYSHGRSWRHPHAPQSRNSIPQGERNLKEYLEHAAAQLTELLTQYGPIASINLEGIDSAREVGQEAMEYQDLYRMMRMLQPQVLISYQQGLTGDEDFFTAEEKMPGEDEASERQGYINLQNHKPTQIRSSLTPGFYSYTPDFAGRHLNVQAVWQKLREAGERNVNFLLNTNLMPDGSLDLEDINTLLEVGKRIQSGGFPAVH